MFIQYNLLKLIKQKEANAKVKLFSNAIQSNILNICNDKLPIGNIGLHISI